MNKSIILSILFSFMGLVGVVKAQSSTVIKMNPLSLGVLTLNVQGEHAFGDKISGQLGFFYGGFTFGNGLVDFGGKISYKWMGITPEFRYYLYSPAEAPEGFYLGPFFRYQNVSANYTTSYYYYDSFSGVYQTGQGSVSNKLSVLGGGVIAGYQFIFGEHFALDMYLGPQFSSGKWKTKLDFNENYDYDEIALRSSFSGFTIRFGTSLGVAF